MPVLDIQQGVLSLTTGGLCATCAYFQYRLRIAQEREKSARARIRSQSLETTLRILPPGGTVVDVDDGDGCRQEVVVPPARTVPVLLVLGPPGRPRRPSIALPSEQDAP